ncbi:glutaredoxin [Candidatus Uhrbacteria bacterium CG10_big_fil_rev_8_21_14_0_10_48_11]|uniref:Glutaredoxin n=1 Tax=Candidatus Uhrbacteria bacterium CG10_big_fil_rev_8_21_14_0_10_48_11 TaxID=1975037 RepID=A0A2M8LEV8_9BACT|nr:MAG: glutaredoxin [Candidatus Uhrbacteria bacterium CG10_big_fil_rev_8_21_14_0_10_48_11]
MLELYQKESCPYCTKVRGVLDELQLDYIVHSMPNGSPKRVFLKTLGGKEQVPFLVDQVHGVSMYESDDIIEYLKNTYVAKN